MGIFNKAIPTIRTNQLNQVRVAPTEEVYIDDIFDPLFNAKAREYLTNKYGNSVLGTLGGYLESIDNALVGSKEKWGILGPGMGILSNFGRSMDKAGDFLIGGATEGVKALTGQGFENPLRNIFVKDQDYTGARLLAAMGNSAAKLASAPKLTEEDFSGLWNIPGTALDLAFDPGIMGNALGKAGRSIDLTKTVTDQPVNSTLAQVGDLLSNYDDFMAKFTMNAAAPGLRPAAKKLKHKILQYLGNTDATNWVNVFFSKKHSPEQRAQAAENLHRDTKVAQSIEMYNEVSKAEEAMPVPATALVTDQSDVQNLLQVPNTPLLPAGSQGLLDQLRAQTTFDTNTGRWLLSQNDIDEMTFQRLKEAYETDLKTLIEKEAAEGADTTALANAIAASNLNDVRHQQFKLAQFLDSDWAKQHLAVTNPDLRAGTEDSLYDLATIQADEVDWFSDRGDFDPNDVDDVAYVNEQISKGLHFAPDDYLPDVLADKVIARRKDLFDRMYDLGVRQRKGLTSTETITTQGRRLVPLSTMDEQFNAMLPRYRYDYVQAHLDNPHYAKLADKTPEELAKLSDSFFPRKLRTLKPYDIPSGDSHTATREFRTGHEDRYALDTLLMPDAPVSADNIDEYLETLQELAEMESTGLDDFRESEINATLRELGFDPKSRKAKFIESSPVTISPSWYTGRSDTTLKLQAQYTHKVFTNFVNKYGDDLINNPTFIRAFPNEKTRNKIAEAIKEMVNVSPEDSALNYIEKARNLTDTIIDSRVALPSEFEKDIASISDLLTQVPYEQLDNTFSFDRMFDAISKKSLPNLTKYDLLEMRQRAEALLPKLEELGVSLEDAARISATPYSLSDDLLKTQERLTKAGFSKADLADLRNYTTVRNTYEQFRAGIAEAYYKKMGLPGNTAMDDLLDASELVQKNVIQPFDRREGPVREINPLQRFESPDEIDQSNQNAVLAQSKDGKGKIRDRSVNDLYSYSPHNVINNLIRLNASAFTNDEALQNLHKFLGDAYQIKVHADYGTFEGVAKNAIDSFKKEALPLVEDVVNAGYTPYMKADKIAKLKKDSPAYKLQALLGNIPGVKGSDYAAQYKQILKEIVQESTFAAGKTGTIAYNVRSSPKMAEYLLNQMQPEIVEELHRLGVSGSYDNLVHRFMIGEKLAPKEWRALNTAFQNVNLSQTLGASADLLKIPYDVPTGYLQLRRRLADAPKSAYEGWIDYSKLYGNRQSQLWEQVTNKSVYSAPWRDPVTFQESPSPKLATEKTISPTNAPNVTTAKQAEMNADSVVANVQYAPTKEAAELVTSPPTPADAIETELLEAAGVTPEQVEHISASRQTPPPESPKEDTSYFGQHKGERKPSKEIFANSHNEQTNDLFDLIHNASAASRRAGSGDKATLRTEHVQRLFDKADILMTRKGITEDDIVKYKNAQIYLSGAAVKKDEFLDTLASSGMFQMAYTPAQDYSKALRAMENNVNVINNAMKAEVLKVRRTVLPNGNTVIGVTWNTLRDDIPNLIHKNFKSIQIDKLQDIVRLAPGDASNKAVQEYLGSSTYKTIDEFFNEVRQQETEYAKLLGFNYADSRHVKNVRNMSPDVAVYLANYVYKDLDTADLDNLADVLMGMDEFKHLRGAWGSRKFDRRFIGYMQDFEPKGMPIFDNDAARIVKGTFGEGTFNNSKFQLYIDLFDNDNFKIRSYADSVEDVKKIFYPEGKSGNLTNLTLAAPRFNADGRIIGFTQFDKTTDAGIAKALSNPDTVLLPANVFSPLDRVLRKDAKMSNKLYAFINKHLTLPFKFGVLMNPGFVIGNVNDAYLKQATTMAQKYGTSMPEELANVAVAIRDVMTLNNNFDDAYRHWIETMETQGIKLPPSAKISSIASKDPKIRKTLFDYLNNKLHKSGPASPVIENILNSDDEATIRLWMLLNSNSVSTSFEDGLRDMDFLAEMRSNQKYRPPKGIIDRITTGTGEYRANNFRTWGLFMNNPLSNKIMDASETVENTFRTASILNDFRHNGITMPEFKEHFEDINQLYDIIRHSPKDKEAAEEMLRELEKEFDIQFSNANNAMAHANFDYERVNNFTDTVGTFVPFPTFFLRNLGYWLEMMVDNPQYIDRAISLQEGLWNGKDTSKDTFLAEAKGRGAIPMTGQNLSKHFKGIYKPTPLQSMFGAFSLINSPGPDVYNRLHPMLSSGIATAAKLPGIRNIAADKLDSDTVKYRPYSTSRFQKNIRYGDKEFNPIAYAIHRNNPVERDLQAAIRLSDKVSAGEWQLSDVLPSIFQPDFSKTKKSK